MRYGRCIMSPRIQIGLDPETQRRARRRASEMGVSLAEYIRRLIDRDLGSQRQVADVTGLFDLGSSGGSNIAQDKDAMLAEAFAPKALP